MPLTGNWNRVLTRLLSVTIAPGDSRGYLPIPPFSYPASDLDFSLTSPYVAIDCFSQASRSNWYVGAWVRVEGQIVGLPTTAIGDSQQVPVNRGARILEIPQWALSGYQLQFEIPYWYEETTLEVYLYAP
jgi:hypothetical protein